MEVKLIGLDIAKCVFQVQGVDGAGEVVLSKRLRRDAVLGFFSALAPTSVAMEACATAHYWARELMALGHEVRLLPPRYVKSYVWRNKTDAADAAAICVASGDPRIHAVPVKTADQQALLALHRVRELLVGQRTTLGNALRAHLGEFGIVAPQGQAGLGRLREAVADDEALVLPATALPALEALVVQWAALNDRVRELERAILRQHRANEASRRLATIPGIGPITATALVASIGDARNFRTGRHLAAWLGLTPREHASGLKRRQGAISKRGDAYLRRLLTLGAQSWLRHHKTGQRSGDPWLIALQQRRPTPVVATALANKTARIAWAVMARGETYRPRQVAS
jgi:transposase